MYIHITVNKLTFEPATNRANATANVAAWNLKLQIK